MQRRQVQHVTHALTDNMSWVVQQKLQSYFQHVTNALSGGAPHAQRGPNITIMN